MDSKPKPYPTRKRRPRLDAGVYIGQCQAFLTICTREKQPVLTTGATPAHLAFLMGESSGRTGHLIPAWVIMPDHIHVLIEGLTDASDICEWVRHFKHRSSMGYRRMTGQPRLWQPSFWDRMLRKEDDRLRAALYIYENPVRKRLCGDWCDWPWSGGHLHERLIQDRRDGYGPPMERRDGTQP